MKLDHLADAFVETLKKTIAGPSINGRFSGLEARLAALEARPLQKWAGIHVAGASYAEASLVTRSGSLWVATTTTTTTPGEPDGDWRLIVKRGTA